MKIDILAFGAHPDDVELSASGTILKHIAAGKTVAIVDLTQGEMGSRGTIETRYEEAKNAAEILGVTYRHNLKMEDGFLENSKENLLKIVEQIRLLRPEIVLANAIEDRHPDHAKGSKLVSEACFLSGLVKVKTSYNNEEQEAYRPKSVYHYIQDRYIKPDFVIDVTQFHDKKMEAILAYKTQFFNETEVGPKTPISGKDFLSFLSARLREVGRPIGVEFAEGFTTEKTLGINSLFDLV
jgi:bacillithiol biosynthesis deacetylase BshB1